MDYTQLGKKRIMRKLNPHTARVRNKIGLLILRAALAAVLVAGFGLFGAGMGLYFGILSNSPRLSWEMMVSGYQSSVIVCVHTGEELVLHAGHNHQTVTIDQIPQHVVNAFVAIEDERFFEHNGIDLRGIGRATHRLVSSGGEVTEGASTITQQLIKNMLGAFDSDFITKLQEQYLAVNLERDLTEYFGGCGLSAKEFILEAYLNIINLGRSNYGIQAAALFYYGVDVWDLTLAQAATIAAITQNPSRFPPDIRPDDNWVRAQLVLDNMLRLELITEDEHYAAVNSDVYDTIVRTESGDIRQIVSDFSCFQDALLDSVRDDLARTLHISPAMANNMIFGGGLRIYSTQVPHLQEIVDRVFLDESYWPASDFSIDLEFHFSIYNTITNITDHFHINHSARTMGELETWMEQTLASHMNYGSEVANLHTLFTPQPQAAFVLLDHRTGHVVALRGVRGERTANRAFNRATQATRSPGSQLKPVAIFGPAFDLGIMQPATVIEDIPFSMTSGGNTWRPRNWWGSRFEGAVTARRAVYRSMNVVSVRAVVDNTIDNIGVETMFDYMMRMGFTTLVEGADGPAVSLGGMTRGVRLIELAGAYGMYANGGAFNHPVLYSRVVGPNGEIILENPVNPIQIVRDTAAYLLIDTMRDTMFRSGATGHRANWYNNQQMRRDIPVAGKTGTSQDSRDLGFSGFTPYFTASIWMGNDSNARMSSGVSNAHLAAWRSIMQEVHENLPPAQFERPDRLTTAHVCRDSGLRPTDLCRSTGRVHSDLFDTRFAPSRDCDVHRNVRVCEYHGLRECEICPSWAFVTRVSVVRNGVADLVAVEDSRDAEVATNMDDGITYYTPEPIEPPQNGYEPPADTTTLPSVSHPASSMLPSTTNNQPTNPANPRYIRHNTVLPSSEEAAYPEETDGYEYIGEPPSTQGE